MTSKKYYISIGPLVQVPPSSDELLRCSRARPHSLVVALLLIPCTEIVEINILEMPDVCAAYGCVNRRCLETRARGVTFHLFPKMGDRRWKWEVALRRDGFVANDRTLICSDHFKAEDFDRTGQTVRIKDGVVPTIFSFPAHLQRSVAIRTTATSRRAEDSLMPDDGAAAERKMKPLRRLRLLRQRELLAADHSYALPASPKAMKAKLEQTIARLRKLQREKNNALRRERRAKNNMLSRYSTR